MHLKELKKVVSGGSVMSYKLTNYERETIINFNDGDDTGSIYTCNRTLIKKLDSFCIKRPDLYQLDKEDEFSKTYIFPKRLVSLRTPRVLNEKQKKDLAKRLSQVRAKNI